jgi:hypothetical protein
MHIGKWILVKHEGEVQRGIVQEFGVDDLTIALDNGIIIKRKYWEVRSCPFNNKKEEA